MSNETTLAQIIRFPRPYRRIIQFELNEISIDVLNSLIAQKKLPNFEKITQSWSYFKTTSEKNYHELEPWIQWTTVHTGKTFAEHQVFHLNDAANLRFPQIWETLSDHQINSAIIGSMNAFQGSAYNSFFFPDPWNEVGKTNPSALQPLWDIISKKVHSHATASFELKELWKGFLAARSLKLPWSLYLKIGGQFLLQTLTPKQKWKMPIYFDWFMIETLKNLLTDSHYRYFTVFLNAVAHYQHHYWRSFEPEKFNPTIKIPDCSRFDDPMTFGYQQYDQMLGVALNLARDPQNLIIISSGLSQEPFTEKEKEGGLHYYRLYHHDSFMKQLGLLNFKTVPLMSRDWQIHLPDLNALAHAEMLLSALQVDNLPLFRVTQNTPHSLFIETAVSHACLDSTIKLHGQVIGTFKEFFKHTAVKSGHHIGIGSLWLSQPLAGWTLSMLPLKYLYEVTLLAFGVHQENQIWGSLKYCTIPDKII